MRRYNNRSQLVVEQIMVIVETENIIGSKKDILEVKNTIAVYDNLDKLNSSELLLYF